MIVKFEKSRAVGTAAAPPSKSYCHRALICAALSEGKSIIKNVALSEDIKATAGCLKSLGAKIEFFDGCASVEGIVKGSEISEASLFCNESGSTLRFLIPVAAVLAKKSIFTGSERLLARPLNVYSDIFNMSPDGGKITVEGGFKGGRIYVDGSVSSQFITGLLFALSLIPGGGEIVLTAEAASKPYLDITLEVLRHFGVNASCDGYKTFMVLGGGFKSCDYTVEGDCSNAAFLDAFNLFSGDVNVSGINKSTLQGDFIYKKYFAMLKEGTPVLPVDDCPDLAPVLLAAGAGLNGCTLTGTKRLKIKESDRGEAMREELLKLGAVVEASEDSIIVKKCALHAPEALLSSHNDHRIAMALSVLCSIYGGKIDGFEATAKSYPTFLNDIKKLGIKAEPCEVQ